MNDILEKYDADGTKSLSKYEMKDILRAIIDYNLDKKLTQWSIDMTIMEMVGNYIEILFKIYIKFLATYLFML